jgi:hypothetical protein
MLLIPRPGRPTDAGKPTPSPQTAFSLDQAIAQRAGLAERVLRGQAGGLDGVVSGDASRSDGVGMQALEDRVLREQRGYLIQPMAVDRCLPPGQDRVEQVGVAGWGADWLGADWLVPGSLGWAVSGVTVSCRPARSGIDDSTLSSSVASTAWNRPQLRTPKNPADRGGCMEIVCGG